MSSSSSGGRGRVSYEFCRVAVIGLDVNCPMCGAFVKSGTSHECLFVKSDRRRKGVVTTSAGIFKNDRTN